MVVSRRLAVTDVDISLIRIRKFGRNYSGQIPPQKRQIDPMPSQSDGD